MSRRRFDFLNLLLRIIQNPSRTIIISSHILTDVEKVIDHVLILDRGRMLRDTTLDDLREEFCRFRLTSLGGSLPGDLPFEDVLHHERSDNQAIFTMRSMPVDQVEERAENINCRAEVLPLSFEALYRLVVAGGKGDAGHE
jgi:ABC-2 type transport system ATP-binding protein